MRSRSHDRGQERAQERETPVERGRRRDERDACEPIDLGRAVSDGVRRREMPAMLSHPQRERERGTERAPIRDGQSSLKDTESKELARFASEAQTMKRENPVKFSAVERDVERLREVSKLEDPRQLKIEIQRHVAMLDGEKDGPTAMRLYTRTLALSTLHAERQAEIVDVRRVLEPTTVPCPIQQSLKPRPLPVLLDFDQEEQSVSPLARRVHKLELSPSPLVRVRDELDTDPITDRRSDEARDQTSDVFMSVARDVDRTAPDVRAQDRARALPPSERTQPVEVDVAQSGPSVQRLSIPGRSDPLVPAHELPTLSHQAVATPNQRFSDERRLRENARERELMRVVYNSERGFLEVREEEPERAIRIEALRSTMQFAPELKTRDQAIAAHGRAWQLRADEKNRDRHRAQEDSVMAFGLLARQRDDEHHALSRIAREQLTAEARSLDGPMREAMRDDLKALLVRGASRDAQFLRREMLRAHDAGAVDEARVMALALDTHPHRPFSTPQETDPSDRHRAASGQRARGLIDEGRTQVSERDLLRLESEIVDLRAAYALREITTAQIERAERVMRIVASVKDRTDAAPSRASSGGVSRASSRVR